MKAHQFMHEMTQNAGLFGRDSKVSVVFEGEQAKTDGSTIYLPSLPDQTDLTNEQVMAMRGFVDHEAGHIRHSNMPRIISFYDKNRNNGREELSKLHNALEDVWMEDRVLREYPGAKKNLNQVQQLTRGRELEQWGKVSRAERDELLSDNMKSSAATVINKNRDFESDTIQELRELLLTEEQDRMGKHYADLARACKNSDEVIELAKKVFQYNQETDQQDQTPEDFDQKAEAGELSDMEGEENEGENSPNYQEGKGKGEAQSEEAEALMSNESNEGDEPSGAIGGCTDNGLRGGYRVFTTAGDKYYKRGRHQQGGTEKLNKIVNDTSNGPAFDRKRSEVGPHVSVMKNKLRRSLMARQQRDWDTGRTFGRLDSKRLVAAYQGVPTVWKRRTDREEHDTAVSILVDLSGSMHGRKVETATQCAVALACCFEDTPISYRISGFSNNGYPPGDRDASGKYHRYERTDHTVFKDYDDSLRVAKSSIARIDEAVGGNNSDYDFVTRELNMLAKRTEKRKVLFVLSDGHVACETDAPASEHERLIRENLTYFKKKNGVESIGIGILSDAVASIYPDHVVVNNVGELSGTVFNKMTALLFKEVRNSGR